MKDYIKVIITALLTALITLTVTGAFNYPKQVRKELQVVEKNANNYTDKRIIEHEKKEDEKFNRVIEKQDFMIKYLDQRFNDLDKRIR